MSATHRLRTRATAEAALGALGEVVEAWGGEWQAASSQLEVPLHAGLRHGRTQGHARAVEQIGGSELVLELGEPQWALDRGAVVMLVVAAAAGVAAVLWPFFPLLAKLAPLGLVLGASVWLVVLSRLRNRGVAELLRDVEGMLADGEKTVRGMHPTDGSGSV